MRLWPRARVTMRPRSQGAPSSLTPRPCSPGSITSPTRTAALGAAAPAPGASGAQRATVVIARTRHRNQAPWRRRQRCQAPCWCCSAAIARATTSCRSALVRWAAWQLPGSSIPARFLGTWSRSQRAAKWAEISCLASHTTPVRPSFRIKKDSIYYVYFGR